MSASEHHETYRRFIEAFNQRDVEAILADMDPDIEFESRFAMAGGSRYHGHDGVRGWLADLDEAWEHIGVEIERVFEDGEETIALITLDAKGRASGLDIREAAAHRLAWRDGKVSSLGYTDRAAAEARSSS